MPACTNIVDLGTCGAMMTETHLGLCHGFEHGLNLLMEIGHQHLLQGLYLVQSVGQKLEAFQHQGPLLHQHVTAGGFHFMVRYAGQIFVFQWLSHLGIDMESANSSVYSCTSKKGNTAKAKHQHNQMPRCPMVSSDLEQAQEFIQHH